MAELTELRESFLKELMILQEPRNCTSKHLSESSRTPFKTKETKKGKRSHTEQTVSVNKSLPTTEDTESCCKSVEITLLGDNNSFVGHTLKATSVACDSDFSHIILDSLQTPIGDKTNVLLRLNDVIAITY